MLWLMRVLKPRGGWMTLVILLLTVPACPWVIDAGWLIGAVSLVGLALLAAREVMPGPVALPVALGVLVSSGIGSARWPMDGDTRTGLLWRELQHGALAAGGVLRALGLDWPLVSGARHLGAPAVLLSA